MAYRNETSQLSIPTPQEGGADPSDPDFAVSVLQPHGITVDRERTSDVLRHFNIEGQGLPDNRNERLLAYRRIHRLDVFLDLDNYDAAREYEAMGVYGCNEAEYADYALTSFFNHEMRRPWLPTDREVGVWQAIRMLQPVQKPTTDTSSKWRSPPLVNAPAAKQYTWDLRPDCAYYISIEAFQPWLLANLDNHVAVVQSRAVCPYLTIDIKSDAEGSLTAGIHTVAAASALALYNRWSVKSASLMCKPKRWSQSDIYQMRHYAITFTGSKWKVWCTVPATVPHWNGCRMFNLCSGKCVTMSGVQNLISVINDIHFWGVETHGKSCVQDIGEKMASSLDANTAHYTLIEE